MKAQLESGIKIEPISKRIAEAIAELHDELSVLFDDEDYVCKLVTIATPAICEAVCRPAPLMYVPKIDVDMTPEDAREAVATLDSLTTRKWFKR